LSSAPNYAWALGRAVVDSSSTHAATLAGIFTLALGSQLSRTLAHAPAARWDILQRQSPTSVGCQPG